MRLKTVIIPGIDPVEILQSCFRNGILAQGFLLTVFAVSALTGGLFHSLRPPMWESVDTMVGIACACLYAAIVPTGLYAEHYGLLSIDEYLHTRGKILKRQLIGAMARVFRQATYCRMALLLAGTTLAMTHVLLTNSTVGLVAFLVGQGLLFHNLPWAFRWQSWVNAHTNMIRNLDESDLW